MHQQEGAFLSSSLSFRRALQLEAEWFLTPLVTHALSIRTCSRTRSCGTPQLMLLNASSEQVTRGKRSRCWEAMLHARAGRLHSRKDESRDAAPAGGETTERVAAIDKEIQALRDLKRKLQGADGSWPLPSSLAAAATTSAVKRSRKLQSSPAEEEGLRRANSGEGRPSLARRRPQSGALPPRPPSSSSLQTINAAPLPPPPIASGAPPPPPPPIAGGAPPPPPPIAGGAPPPPPPIAGGAPPPPPPPPPPPAPGAPAPLRAPLVKLKPLHWRKLPAAQCGAADSVWAALPAAPAAGVQAAQEQRLAALFPLVDHAKRLGLGGRGAASHQSKPQAAVSLVSSKRAQNIAIGLTKVTALPYAEIAGAIASLNAHGVLGWEDAAAP